LSSAKQAPRSSEGLQAHGSSTGDKELIDVHDFDSDVEEVYKELIEKFLDDIQLVIYHLESH